LHSHQIMRHLLFVLSLGLMCSVSWGLNTKTKTRRQVLSQTDTSLTAGTTPLSHESVFNLALRATSYESQFAKADIFL